MLLLVLLLPALAHTDGVMCEVGLCGEVGQTQRVRESLTLIPASLEKTRLSLRNRGVTFLGRGLEEVDRVSGSRWWYIF